MFKLSIVIPVYNEERNIRRTLDNIKKFVKTPHNIFVIYDFDEDNTLPALKGHDVSAIKNSYGTGVLGAIKTGFEVADSPFVLVTMADSSDDAADIDIMVTMAEQQNLDIVCASRYMKGGRQIGGGLKKLLSKAADLSLCRLAKLPTHDATNSFKLYRKSFLARQKIESPAGFSLGIELVAKAYVQGGKIGEIPTTWQDRTDGKSRFRLLSWLPHYLKWYFYAWKGLFKCKKN